MRSEDWPKETHEALNMSLGQGTNQKYFDSDTAKDTTHSFFAIQILNDAVFSDLTDSNADETDVASNELSGITLPAGLVLYGDFSGIALTSGVIYAVREG